MIHSGVMS